MNRPTVSRALAGPTAAVVLVVLAACDANIYQSAGGVKLDGEHVEFAVCEPISGAEIRVFGDQGNGTEDVRYMQAVGDVRLVPGEPISSAEIPVGVTASVWNDPVVPGDARVGLFVYDDHGGVEFPVYFPIPEGGLSSSLWTWSDGTQHADPCDDSAEG